MMVDKNGLNSSARKPTKQCTSSALAKTDYRFVKSLHEVRFCRKYLQEQTWFDWRTYLACQIDNCRKPLLSAIVVLNNITLKIIAVSWKNYFIIGHPKQVYHHKIGFIANIPNFWDNPPIFVARKWRSALKVSTIRKTLSCTRFSSLSGMAFPSAIWKRF